MGSCRKYILNDTANTAYARVASHGRDLRQPVLFVNGDWDPICDINCSRLGEPTRRSSHDLSVTNLPAGHWVSLERKTELTQAIRSWLKTKGLQ